MPSNMTFTGTAGVGLAFGAADGVAAPATDGAEDRAPPVGDEAAPPEPQPAASATISTEPIAEDAMDRVLLVTVRSSTGRCSPGVRWCSLGFSRTATTLGRPLGSEITEIRELTAAEAYSFRVPRPHRDPNADRTKIAGASTEKPIT
jgi:hypothetical protein